MTQAFNLGQLANFVNTSGQLDASTGLYNTTSLGFPTGTRMSFNQTAAPTGWTKDTTAAINDSILRLVTGAVSSGGSTAFSTWNSSGTTGSYTLATADIPSHTHSINIGNTFGSGGGGGGTGNITSGATGGGGSHSHTLSNNIKYYDFIIASKN
jgi:N-methylhydantoinase B/oxoprolinase/acetone carboxylase alpha subunit